MTGVAMIPVGGDFGRKRRLPQQLRRQQLLACAIAVAARKGLGRTVHTEIAAAAGVSTPTVFSYFPTRRELLVAVTAEIDRFYMALAHAHHDEAADPLAALRGHLEGFMLSIDSDPDHAKVWLEWSALVRNEDGLWDGFLDFQERIIKMLAATIRHSQRVGAVSEKVSPTDAARLLTASSYALAQLKFMGRSPRMIRRYIDQVIELTLK